jgi:signal transduction histidine kinase
VQRIALELRPSALDHLGLSEAIRGEAKRFEHRTGIRCQLSLPGEPPQVEAGTSTVFFRIFQELLTNVVRHARAKSVDVKVAEEANDLVMDVRDDGIGMEADALHRPTSLGLLGMSERALAMGGQIRFDGQPGRGTQAVLRIPRHRL